MSNVAMNTIFLDKLLDSLFARYAALTERGIDGAVRFVQDERNFFVSAEEIAQNPTLNWDGLFTKFTELIRQHGDNLYQNDHDQARMTWDRELARAAGVTQEWLLVCGVDPERIEFYLQPEPTLPAQARK